MHQVGVRTELRVCGSFVEFVPPLVAAGAGASAATAFGPIVEVVHQTTVVLVPTLDPKTFACRLESQSTKTDHVALNGKGVQVRDEPPLGDQLIQRDIDAFSVWVGGTTMRDFRSRGRPWTRANAGISASREGAKLVLADSFQVVGNARAIGGAQVRRFALIELILLDHGIEHAPAQSLFAFCLRIVGVGHRV